MIRLLTKAPPIRRGFSRARTPVAGRQRRNDHRPGRAEHERGEGRLRGNPDVVTAPAPCSDAPAPRDTRTPRAAHPPRTGPHRSVRARGPTPGRGASLATYFVGQCKIQFPNVYRSWHAEEKRRRELGVLYDTERVSREDPEAVAVGRGSAASILDQMPPLVADVFRLKYLEGYSYAEISDMVPGVPNAKAAENMVTRERAKWRNARQAG